MQSASDLLGSAGGKPKLITLLTSGTGTYVPTVDMARCLVRIQAGGAGGASTGNYAGGAGAMIEVFVRIPIAGLAYSVGAGGAIDGDGSMSTLGQFSAMPGTKGTTIGGAGGIVGALVGSVDTDGATITVSGMSGVSGGFGGYGSAAGGLPGFPLDLSQSTNWSAPAPGPYAAGVWTSSHRNGQGNASGGNSFYGKGGTTGNAPATTAYGAGGGFNAAGRGGCIEIFDFGA